MLPLFRDRLYLVALLVCIGAVGGLIAVASHAPSANGSGWEFDQTTYTVLATMLSTALSVGLLSLIVELFLRESYARALRRFLNLKTTLVQSGLLDISVRPGDLSERIERATTVRAIARDPHAWVLAHYSSVVMAAVKRQVHVSLLVPDAEGEHFPAVAESLDVTPDELRNNIDLALGALKQQWGSVGPIHPGSTISVRAVQLPLYDITCVDDLAICTLGSSVEYRQGTRRVVLSFEGADGEAQWLRSQIGAAEEAGELWAADDRTPPPRRRSMRSQDLVETDVQNARGAE